MEPIQYIGLDDLEAADRVILDKLSAEYYEKLKFLVKNELSLVIHIKAESKGGKPKYDINIKAVAPTRHFQSTKAEDWDFARTLHKAFKDLEVQIKHALHSDDQKPR